MRRKTKFTAAKEAKRRSRSVFGQVRKSSVILDKRRKKPKHKHRSDDVNFLK